MLIGLIRLVLAQHHSHLTMIKEGSKLVCVLKLMSYIDMKIDVLLCEFAQILVGVSLMSSKSGV